MLSLRLNLDRFSEKLCPRRTGTTTALVAAAVTEVLHGKNDNIVLFVVSSSQQIQPVKDYVAKEVKKRGFSNAIMRTVGQRFQVVSDDHVETAIVGRQYAWLYDDRRPGEKVKREIFIMDGCVKVMFNRRGALELVTLEAD